MMSFEVLELGSPVASRVSAHLILSQKHSLERSEGSTKAEIGYRIVTLLRQFSNRHSG